MQTSTVVTCGRLDSTPQPLDSSAQTTTRVATIRFIPYQSSGMRVAITGASGFVGSAAASLLRARGDEVVRLVRGADSAADAALWDPTTGDVDRAALGTIDAIVHLAGDNVASGRWTANKKRAIVDSRVPTTERLCRTLAALKPIPRTLVSASAVGFYGNRGDEVLTEDSAPGDDFLAETSVAWEAATKPAREAGIRVVNLRVGMVLDPAGGALTKMILPFKLGLGGRLGSGKHWISWITRNDLVRAIAFALDHASLAGPTNGTAPEPVTNKEFTRALGHALRRPTILPAPAFGLRMLLGEMADLLLASTRALPNRLLDAGFEFEHTRVEDALMAQLREISQEPN